MKRFLFTVLLLGMPGISLLAQKQAKLSPFTRLYLEQAQKTKDGTLPRGYVYKKAVDGSVYISALIKTGGQLSDEALNQLGVRIGTRAGKIWTAQIPVANINAFSRLAGIDYIQLDEPLHAMMDSARKLTRVDSVHAGLGGLPMPYTGKDVVVGIIDAGFDYRHPTFFDTTGASYRVRRIWEQKITGTPPPGFSYGNEITDTLDMWSKGWDMDFSHGAHVGGIAAGSGRGSADNRQFRGIAYNSDLVFVGIKPNPDNWTTTGMSDIIDGMSYIYSYAATVGKPAVVNLSWGCCIGPHDGSSLFSQACDNLTGPGKLFACSAGNNGDQNLHLRKTFTAADTAIHSFVSFDPSLGEKRTWIDIWGDTAKSFCVKLSLYNLSLKIDSTVAICLDGQLHQVQMIGSNNDTFFATITTEASEFNGKPRIFMDIYSKVPNQVLVTVTGTDGEVDLWTGYVKEVTGYYGDFRTNGFPWTTGGNRDITIGDMASTRSAITVGAYASRVSYTNISGGNVNYNLYATRGKLAPFSSHGPTADGRVKPDISAPGLVVGSAVNSYDPEYITGGGYSSVVYNWTDPQNSRSYSYAMLMGTSMSSPVVAGIVALMLEANPTLTPNDAQYIIATTAIEDEHTTDLPDEGNNLWGHGKINALAAVRKATELVSVKDISHSLAYSVYPNPASSQFTIDYPSESAGQLYIEVFDLLGKKIFTENRKHYAGSNTYRIATAEWGSGVYFIRVTSSRGQGVTRLVIN